VRPASPRALRDERGFALLAVILVLALLSVVVTEFAFSVRLEASMVRAYRDGILGRNLAEAGVQQAIRELLTDSNVQGLDEDGQVAFYTVPPGGTEAQRLPSLTRRRVPLGAGEFSYRITDEEGRLSINSGQTARTQRLLQAIGMDKSVRDTIVDSIEDWRDANDTSRPAGAESEDYLKLPVPYRARNANLQDIAELLQIKGITPEIYYGSAEKPGLVDIVTAWGPTTLNLNTASSPALAAMGFSDAEISAVVQTRKAGPYPSVPSQFGARRMTTASNTFRIEAEGIVGGEPRARIVAIVQKSSSSAGTGPSATVLSWRRESLRPLPKDGAPKS
jgi:general secretion pathway protein K